MLPPDFDFDLTIVGAGVVGLACARRLGARGRRVLLVERNARAGEETSSRHSQVLHAGMYYPTGSWKARLCVRGNRSLAEYAAHAGVVVERVGKLIIAASAEEEPALAQILARGLANGVDELVAIDGPELLRREPNALGVSALWSPRTGIIDSHGLLRALEADARRREVELVFRHALRAVTQVSGGYRLALEDPAGQASDLTTRQVVNAAGLASDEVAALAGIDVEAAGYRLHYVKGNYFRVHPRRRGLARHLLYPVPAPRLAGLGVHLTLELDGQLRLGPDTEPVERTAFSYAVDEGRAPAFAAAAARYVRGLELGDLSPDQSGIRPKLAGVGAAPADFVIADERARGLPGWVNLIGIESPGLTSCLEIADEVAILLEVG